MVSGSAAPPVRALATAYKTHGVAAVCHLRFAKLAATPRGATSFSRHGDVVANAQPRFEIVPTRPLSEGSQALPL